MSSLRKMVLQSFKKLHRTRLKVFQGDERALTAAKIKINEKYRKNKHVKDEEAIKAVCNIGKEKLAGIQQKMIKFGEDVEKELRTQVIQAKEIKPGIFEAKITEDTLKLDNIPYNDAALPIDGTIERHPCCQDEIKNK